MAEEAVPPGPAEPMPAEASAERPPCTPGYLAALGLEDDGPPVRTRLVAAQQRLAVAGLLSDRLANEVAVETYQDLLTLVAAAMPPPVVACVFSGLVDAKGGVFDRGGALYHIATQGGTAAWQHPAAAGRVAVAWSSVGRGSPSDLVSGPAREGWSGGQCRPQEIRGQSRTNNHEGSWMAVDLGAGWRMEVTGYALRHGGHAACRVQSWELQGSVAAERAEWVTLDKREGDETVSLLEGWDNAYHAGYWAVNQAAARGMVVRHVRILQTGKNSSGNDFLYCGGLELYGVLHEVA